MRVLYIGVYRDSTGYAEMAVRTMLALDSAGVEVTARPIKLNRAQADIPDAVRRMEAGGGGPFDAVIENILPHMIDFCGRIPVNICYYCTETSRFDGTNWPDRLNTMDQAWVCNAQSAMASATSGVHVPIRVIPIACDPDRYQRRYGPLPLRGQLAESFVFYTIGEFQKRKNFGALLRAFHLEFDPDEPVELVIKTSIPGIEDASEARRRVSDRIREVQAAIKLYPTTASYKQPVIITERYTADEMMRLHASCDCYVCPSYGEAWNFGGFDAMGMGKMPIVTNGTGFRHYMTHEIGWMVPAATEPVFGMHESSFGDMFTGREHWDAVDIDSLRSAMRLAYTATTPERKRRAAAGLSRAHDFSLSRVGRRMVEVIGESLDDAGKSPPSAIPIR